MKMCEKRRNSATPATATAMQVVIRTTDRLFLESVLGREKGKAVQRTLPLASEDLNSSPSSGADSSE